MKKFTGNFLLGEHGFGNVLRRIGLSMVAILMAVAAFAQPQETYHVWADDTSYCYQEDNIYEVPVYMKDFIKIDSFGLTLEFDELVFSYYGVTDIIDTLSGMSVVNSAAGVLTMTWDEDSVSTIGETAAAQNEKTHVFTLQFALNGVPHNYGPTDAATQYSFSSTLEWDEAASEVWNDVGQITEILTDFTSDGDLEINQDIMLSDIELSNMMADCAGSMAQVTVVSPAGLEYSFDGNTFTSSGSTNVQAPETGVTLVIQDGECISYIYTFDVEAPDSLEFATADSVYTNCPAGKGDIEIHATGGSTPYTYYVVPESAWATVTTDFGQATNKDERNAVVAQYATGNAVSQVNAGDATTPEVYYVAVQDANGCIDLGIDLAWWQTVEVFDTLVAIRTSSVTLTDLSCNESGNGEVDVTITGGAPYDNDVTSEYGYKIWFDGVLESTIGFSVSKTNLSAGEHTIEVQDGNGCTWDTTVVLTEPDAIAFDVDHTDTGCEEDNGTITLLTASIDGGVGVDADDVTFTDGEVLWTDAPTLTGGTTPYWIIDTVPEVNRPGSSTEPLWAGDIEAQTTVTGLPAGVYYISIVDANGCQDDYENINDDDAVKLLTYEIDLDYTPIACTGDSTVVTVNIDGAGEHDLRYKVVSRDSLADVYPWTETTNMFKLPAGRYRFMVQDQTIGCMYRYNETITEPTPIETVPLGQYTLPPTCIDNTDGNLAIQASGGTPFEFADGTPYYKYKMDDGPWVQTTNYTTFAVDTAEHYIYVEDANGCMDTLYWPGFRESENYIQFEEVITVDCTGDMINLFNKNPDDDYYDIDILTCGIQLMPELAIVCDTTTITLDEGYVEGDWSWYGWGYWDEHDNGTDYDEYRFWTSAFGWDTVAIQGYQQQRNPMLYYSAETNVPSEIVANGDPITHETSFGAGTYYIVAMDEWGCYSNVDTVTVVEPDPLAIDVSVIGAGCDGATDGQIRVTALNGNENIPDTDMRYQYVLTQSPQIFSHPNWVENATWVPFVNGDPANDSLAVITAQDGVYWLAVRDYCGVADPALIQFEGPIDVAGANPIVVDETMVTVNNVTCVIDGETTVYDGSILGLLAAVSGGFGDYTLTLEATSLVDGGSYSLVDTSGVGDFVGLAGGTYLLTIEDDSLGCVGTETFTITQPDPLMVTYEVVYPSCFDTHDGILRYIIEGGTAPYMEATNNVGEYENPADIPAYRWVDTKSEAMYVEAHDQYIFDRRVRAGEFEIYVKDSLGCIYGPLTVTVEEPDPLTLSLTSEKVSCNPQSGENEVLLEGSTDDGTITATFGGGWDMADAFDYKLQLYKGGTAVGSMVAIDESGTYTWTGLSAGDYSVKMYEENDTIWADPIITYTDYFADHEWLSWAPYQNGTSDCVIEATETVEEPEPIVYDVNWVQVKCYNTATGMIELTNIAGGTPGLSTDAFQGYLVGLEGPQDFDPSLQTVDAGTYTEVYPVGSDSIVWYETVDDAFTFNNLTWGHYTVHIRDLNDCWMYKESGEIENPDTLMLTVVQKLEDAECYGGLGLIQLDATGGSGYYEYAVDSTLYPHPGSHLFPNTVDPDAYLASLNWQSSDTFEVGAATWIGYVRDSLGCVAGFSTDENGAPVLHHRTTILQPDPVEADGFGQEGATCYDEADGKIMISTVWGGQGGNWRIVVTGTDYAGNAVDTTYQNISASSSITLGGLKASTVYTDTDDMGADDYYSIVVYDNANCPSAVYSQYVTQPEEFMIELKDKQNAFICPNDQAGLFEIETVKGGTAPFEYKWEVFTDTSYTTKIDSLSDDIYGSVPTFLGYAGYAYRVYARDAQMCEATQDTFITAPDPIDFMVENITCHGAEKASVRVTAMGTEGRKFRVLYKEIEGETPAPSVFTPFNGWFTESIELNDTLLFDTENLEDVHYVFVVEDTLGCQSEPDTFTFDLVQHPLTVTAVVDAHECDADVAIAVTGGTPGDGYVITLNGEEITETTQLLGEGTYNIMVVDANECEAMTTVEVVVNPVVRDTTVQTYIGVETAFTDVESGVDTMLAEGVHELPYDYEGCPRVLNVTVEGVPMPATIIEIQGEVEESPLVDRVIVTSGTVTGVAPGEGFFMQDANLAWSGIWVAYSDATTDGIQIGNGVEVVGAVAEVADVTTINATEVTIANPVLTVEPIVVELPSDAEAEMYESVLVKVEGARATAADPGNGEWTAYEGDLGDIVVNDWLFSYTPTEGNFYNVTGIVNGRLDAFKLEPRITDDIVDLTATPVEETPVNVQFKVYPNPFNDRIMIENNDKLTRVIVSNVAGQRVIDVEYPSHEIRTANLVSGVYFVSLITEEGIAKTERIVKR